MSGPGTGGYGVSGRGASGREAGGDGASGHGASGTRRGSIVARVVRGTVFVALLSSLVLATTAAIVARVLWRSSEEREIDATTSALVRVILAEAEEDKTSVEKAVPGALDESAVVGYRIEVVKEDGELVVARPARAKATQGAGAPSDAGSAAGAPGTGVGTAAGTEAGGAAEADVGWLVRTARLPEHLTLRVALPEERGRRALRIFALSLALSAPVCLLMAAAVGWYVGRRTTRPLVAFAARIADIQGLDTLSDPAPENGVDNPIADDTAEIQGPADAGRHRLEAADRRSGARGEEARSEGAQRLGIGPGPGAEAPAEVADLERAFRELLDRLRDQVAREREFAGNASHELRTPLTAIRLRAERARQGAGSGAASELDGLLMEIDRMVRLVDSLLVLARDVRSGVPRGEVVNLADITRDAVGRVFTGAPTPEAELPDEALVRGDEALLGIAVENLLDNARKFTPRDAPSRIGLDSNASRVRLTVTSPGARISTAEREKLFERFYRGPQARESRDGHGLGLPLAKHIALLHGGSLACLSGPSEDARFTLELPAWRAEPGPGESRRGPEEVAALRAS